LILNVVEEAVQAGGDERQIRKKVKVPRKRPEGPEGGRGIALLFLDLGVRRGWVFSRFTPRKNLVPIVQEAG
jgi:hypothetical protein